MLLSRHTRIKSPLNLRHNIRTRTRLHSTLIISNNSTQRLRQLSQLPHHTLSHTRRITLTQHSRRSHLTTTPNTPNTPSPIRMTLNIMKRIMIRSITSTIRIRPTHNSINHSRSIRLPILRLLSTTLTRQLQRITISHNHKGTTHLRLTNRLLNNLLNTNRSSRYLRKLNLRSTHRHIRLIRPTSRPMTLTRIHHNTHLHTSLSLHKVTRVPLHSTTSQHQRHNQRRHNLTLLQHLLRSTLSHISRTRPRRLINLIRRSITSIIRIRQTAFRIISSTPKHTSSSLRTTPRHHRLQPVTLTAMSQRRIRILRIHNMTLRNLHRLSHRLTHQHRRRHLHTHLQRISTNRSQRYRDHNLTNTNLNLTRRITTNRRRQSNHNLSQQQQLMTSLNRRTSRHIQRTRLAGTRQATLKHNTTNTRKHSLLNSK